MPGVGSVVQAKTKQGWRRGSITAKHDDGTVDVTFEHGSVGKKWRPGNVRNVEEDKDYEASDEKAAPSDGVPNLMRMGSLFYVEADTGKVKSPGQASGDASQNEPNATAEDAGSSGMDAQFAVGSKVEVYSQTRKTWMGATVTGCKNLDGDVIYTVIVDGLGREARVPEENVRIQAWSIASSTAASRTKNPIRALVDGFKLDVKIPGKPLIPLSIGDPSAFPNLPVHESVKQAVATQLFQNKVNGYGPSVGLPQARQAVADKFSRPGFPISKDDVILASGASDALNIAIAALVNEGDNILVPKPGFTLYQTICDRYGLESRYYDLDPAREWECDLDSMRSLINDRTKVILVNNPSNPCGSVWTRKHIEDIVALAEEFKLPIIADEIYANMVFEGYEYVSFDSVSKEVPIVSVGGISKQYVAPGWRLGWIIIQDRKDRLKAARAGFVNLSQVILGPNALIQGALPDILHKTPQSYYTWLNKQLQTNSMIVFNAIEKIQGLTPVRPGGAMYLMVGIDSEHFPEYNDDVEFCKALVIEQAVFVLPGTIFGAVNFFRVVVCPPPDKLNDAMDRLKEFCTAHYK